MFLSPSLEHYIKFKIDESSTFVKLHVSSTPTSKVLHILKKRKETCKMRK